MKLYGLKSCDSCRKALKWLGERGLDADIVDVRSDGFTEAEITRIVSAAGWETALNRKSATWRGLSEAARNVSGSAQAIALIAANPTLLKRPVIEADGRFIIGFAAAQQAELRRLTGRE